MIFVLVDVHIQDAQPPRRAVGVVVGETFSEVWVLFFVQNFLGVMAEGDVRLIAHRGQEGVVDHRFRRILVQIVAVLPAAAAGDHHGDDRAGDQKQDAENNAPGKGSIFIPIDPLPYDGKFSVKSCVAQWAPRSCHELKTGY